MRTTWGRTASTTRSRTETVEAMSATSRSRSGPTRPRPRSTTSVEARTGGNPVRSSRSKTTSTPTATRGRLTSLTAPTPDVETDTAHGRSLRGLRRVRVHLRRRAMSARTASTTRSSTDTGGKRHRPRRDHRLANLPPEAVDDSATRARSTSSSTCSPTTPTPRATSSRSSRSRSPPRGGDHRAREGTITYSQTSNFSAADSFTYTITDRPRARTRPRSRSQACPALAPAIGGGGIVTSERWVACSALRRQRRVGPTTTVFPPQGGTSALLTSGDIALAPGPNDDERRHREQRNRAARRPRRLHPAPRPDDPRWRELSLLRSRLPERGVPRVRRTPLQRRLPGRARREHWSVDGRGDHARRTTSPSTRPAGSSPSTAPSSSPSASITATGSQYDGSTPLLNVRTPITPGAHALYLSIFDAGDTALDSAAFVDASSPAPPGRVAARPGRTSRRTRSTTRSRVHEDTVTARSTSSPTTPIPTTARR